MAVTAQGSGTQTASIIPNEYTLLDVAVPGTFTLHVDRNAMAAGDVLELRVYQMVLTGGTRRVVYKDVWTDAPAADDVISISVPISNELTDAGALRFTLNQIAGAAKAYPWKVLKYA
jgi:hypothetical protein